MSVNVYQMVTDRILEQMSNGIIPWHKPWHGTLDGAISYVSRKPYSILNQFLLGEAGEYLTFNQIKSLGGKLKKGSKSKFVVFYKPIEIKKKAGGEEDDDKRSTEVIPMLRFYNVFHLKDTEGIPTKIQEEDRPKLEPIAEADKIISDYVDREKLDYRVQKSDSAYYRPSDDMVVVPLIEQYDVVEEFYSTAFHELVHSTGHKSRLNRFECAIAFRSENYSREELVAEIGSSMLSNIAGINHDKSFRNSVAYIQGWASALKSEPKLIVSASSRAEKATKYILGEITQ